MNHLKFPLLILSLAVFSCTNSPESGSTRSVDAGHPNLVSLTQEQYDAAGIVTGHPENMELSGAIAVTGMLDVPPQNLVNITAPFGGFLRQTSLLQGMHIKKGQVIATVENPEYVQLQQDFLDTKSQVEFLEKEYQRQQELAKESVNAQKTLQKSAADLASMKARNSGLRAKLSMLNIQSENLTPGAIQSTIELLSPINGYVTQVNSALGAFVNPTDVMFQIVDTEHLHAELIAFEKDIPKIKIGQKIRLTLMNETKERTAKVYLIGREISRDRTVRIHGHLDDEDHALIPGMYLKAFIETGGNKVMALPEEAVLNFENKDYVFAKDKASPTSFLLIEVTAGVRQGGFVEVASKELNLQSTVATKGAYKLLSKMKNSETGEEPGH